MNKGSIQVQRDPLDSEEWQFKLRTEVAWDEELTTHEHKAQSGGKQEAISWMKIKGQVLPSESHNTANEALEAVVPGKRRRPLAIEDKKGVDDEASAPETDEKDSKLDKNNVFDAEQEAEKLSQIGGKGGTEAKARISKMLKLVEKVKGEVGSKKAAYLKESEAALKVLLKKSQQWKLQKKNSLTAHWPSKKQRTCERFLKKQGPAQGLYVIPVVPDKGPTYGPAKGLSPVTHAQHVAKKRLC